MKFKFIPLDYSPFDFKGKNYIKLIGRTEKGKRICVIDSYDANLWAIFKKGIKDRKVKEIQSKIEKIKVENASRKTKVLKTELHNKKFLGKDVKALKIFINNHKDAHDIADKIEMEEIEKRRGYDIPIISKYIMEKKIRPFEWYEAEGEILNSSQDLGGIDSVLDVDFCIKAENISKLKKQEKFLPKILAFDIEVDKLELGKGEVLMVSLYGEENGKTFKKVLTWKCKIKKRGGFVECFKDEEEMLKKFVGYVKYYSPDILVGYFSDGFDLPYLRASAEKNKIKLNLGLDNSSPVFARGRIPSGKICGIVHVDLFRFIQTAYSQYLQSETLSLNDVASELLGEKKHDFDFRKLGGKMNEKDWVEFFSYNLQDSILTYKLAEKIWPDLVEFSKIMQEPLFDVSRDGMSAHVENYILHNLEEFNEIAEKRPTHDEISRRRSLGKYEGAFVFQPTPGLYEDIVMFDFTSMYGSVIVSYNLSLSTFLEKREKNAIGVNISGDKKVYFSKQKGFFPTMLEGVINKRKKYKNEYNKDKNALTKARSNAYKLLANASYGYQGFFGARYYCREAAAATAALARRNILNVIDKIKKQSYEIVYSDTDSIAFLKGKKTKKEVLDFLEELNLELPGIMELELEDFYRRGLFVSKRTTSAGAKKKYALIDEKNKLKIRGFETVRRDWCDLARELQNKVLEKVLREGNEKSALKIAKEIVNDIKNRNVLKEKLIIKTQLKKPINEYLSQGPHVIAAKKMQALEMPVSVGMVIEYYISEVNDKKKKLVREKVKLPNEEGEYNVEYYLNNQILPAVENIFEVFGVEIKDFIEGYKQKGLSEF